MRYPVFAASLLVGFLALGCSAQPAPEIPSVSEASATPALEKASPPEPATEVPSDSPVTFSGPPPVAKPLAPEVACKGGVIQDDGAADTGYGFVPQATAGMYVQRFESQQFPSTELDNVCVCFLKTKYVNNIEFDVVFFEEVGGRPAAKPYASFPFTAQDVPKSVPEARMFFEGDVSGVRLPEGASYIGVRWDPNRFKFLFVCTDANRSKEPRGEPVPVFFQDDVKPHWQSVFDSRDPIFRNHHSILLRAEAVKAAPEPKLEEKKP